MESFRRFLQGVHSVMGDIQGHLKDMLSKSRRESLGTVLVPVPFCVVEGSVAVSPAAAQSTAFGGLVISSLCLHSLIHCITR